MWNLECEFQIPSSKFLILLGPHERREDPILIVAGGDALGGVDECLTCVGMNTVRVEKREQDLGSIVIGAHAGDEIKSGLLNLARQGALASERRRNAPSLVSASQCGAASSNGRSRTPTWNCRTIAPFRC
jgi:hypothetical protein